jgi:hypothetical protein
MKTFNGLIEKFLGFEPNEKAALKSKNTIASIADKLHPKLELPYHQRESLERYIGSANINGEDSGESAYKSINDFHRGLTSPKNIEDIKEHSKNLDNILSNHKINHSVHVYRGLGVNHPIKYGKIGEVLHDKGYVSTTLEQGLAKYFSKENHLAHIKVPKGSNAMYVNHGLGMMNNSESEILFPRNSKFRYDGKTKYNEYTVHHLTHIPEGSK